MDGDVVSSTVVSSTESITAQEAPFWRCKTPAKSTACCAGFHSTFHAGKTNFGQRTVLPVQTLRDPLNGYLDSTQCLHLLIEIAAPNTQEIVRPAAAARYHTWGC